MELRVHEESVEYFLSSLRSLREHNEKKRKVIMASIEITKQNFEDTIKDGIVLLDFWDSWCGPCSQFVPIFEIISEAHPDIKFGKVNTEEQPAIAGSFGITAIPTLAAFRDNILIFQQAGALNGAALEDLISKIRELDMDKVRAEIADQEAK